jgi:hypothetical protein
MISKNVRHLLLDGKLCAAKDIRLHDLPSQGALTRRKAGVLHASSGGCARESGIAKPSKNQNDRGMRGTGKQLQRMPKADAQRVRELCLQKRNLAKVRLAEIRTSIDLVKRMLEIQPYGRIMKLHSGLRTLLLFIHKKTLLL